MKGRYLSVILALCMFCTLCLSPLTAGAEQTTTLFTGTVVNTSGGGLSGVTVQASSQSTQTDSSGAWSLALPSGSYTFTFSKAGYAFSSTNASSGGNTQVNCGAVTGTQTATKAPTAAPTPAETATQEPATGTPAAINLIQTQAPAATEQATQASAAKDEPKVTDAPVESNEPSPTDVPDVFEEVIATDAPVPENEHGATDTPQGTGDADPETTAGIPDGTSDAPVVTAPGAYVTTSAFTIAWTAVDGAEGYLLTLEDINHNTKILEAARVEDTAYAVAAGTLTSGQRYTVSVSALVGGAAGDAAKLTFAYLPGDTEETDDEQTTGANTPISIMPMAAPIDPNKQQLATPSVTVTAEASTLRITAAWGAVTNASYYQISLYDTTAGTAVFEDRTTAGTSYVIYEALTKDHHYLVEVYACPAVGDTTYTASSAGEGRFMYVGTSQTADGPAITTQIDAYFILNGTGYPFDWSAVANATGYEWTLTRDGSAFASGTVTDSSCTTGPIELNSPGQYVFAVRAQFADGTYTKYSTFAFTAVNNTQAYVMSYTMDPNSWTTSVGMNVSWSFINPTNVSANTTHIRLIVDNVVKETKPIATNAATLSHTFTDAGIYQIQFQASMDGATWGPLTDPQMLTVTNASGLAAPVLNAIGQQTAGTAFTVRWGQVAGATSYALTIEGITNGFSQTYTPGTVTSQQVTLTDVGRYKATVTASAASISDSKSSAVEFEVVAGASASWTGYIQAYDTPAYASSAGGTATTTFALNTAVTVLGESGGYYYVQFGGAYYFVGKGAISSVKAATVTGFTVPTTAAAGVVTIGGITVENGNGTVQLIVNSATADTFQAAAGLTKSFAAGTYSIQLRAQNANGEWGPYSIIKTIDVTTPQARPVLRSIGIQYVRQDFTVRWSTIADVSYYELILKDAGGYTVTVYPMQTTANNYFNVYGRTISKIGKYSLTVVAHLTSGATVSSDPVTFDVVEAGFRAWIGIVVPRATDIYSDASTADPIGTLYRNQKVTVIGETGRYYLIHVNSRTCYVLKSAIAWWANTYCYGDHVWGDTVVSKTHPHTSGTQTCKYCSATRTIALKASKLKGCKTCYPSSGSAASKSTEYTVLDYVGALGSAAQRRPVYEYVTDLYAGLDGEPSMNLTELLSVCFAPLPSQMQASEYTTANGNAAWYVTGAYLALLVDEALTDEVAASENALPLIAASVGNTLESLLATDVELDSNIRTALLAISAQCANIAGSGVDGTYSNSSVAQAALAAILDGMPYDEELVAKIEQALATTGGEPLQERALRVAYVLAGYANDTLAGFSAGLSNTSSYSDVSAAHSAYLEYLLLVSRLNQTAEAIGGASSGTVSSRWSTETVRRDSVFSLYDKLY